MQVQKKMIDKIRKVLGPYKRLYKMAKLLAFPILFMRDRMFTRSLTNEFICSWQRRKEDCNIFYFGLPEHDNLGDLGQAYCITKWIHENYPTYNLIKTHTRTTTDRKFLNFFKKIVKCDDIIIMQSGYCTRDNNKDHVMHMQMCRLYPNNRIIIMPQTVNLISDEEIAISRKVFWDCKRLLFIARDKISYERAKAFVKDEQLSCFPDIVTSLIGRLKYRNDNRDGVLLCVRNDDEKYYTNDEIAGLKNALLGVFQHVEINDTNSDYSIDYIYRHFKEVICEKIKVFNKYKVCITDRFHGTIFSLIANTPVIVVKTNDHKVISGVEWFSSFPEGAVIMADNLSDAYCMAVKCKNDVKTVVNPPVLYEEYYKSKLKELIDKL